MLILKRIGAFNQLETFAQDEWDRVGELVKCILDNDLQDVFDNLVNDEFPNGCEEYEFKRFCVNEQDFIFGKLKSRDF